MARVTRSPTRYRWSARAARFRRSRSTRCERADRRDRPQSGSRQVSGAHGSVRDQDVRRLTIATSGTGDRDLFVSYVSEVPVWKATYRLVLPAPGETRRPLLQGWAIVDNTVGEDWENVELSLVAGAPQSFIQQISRPYYVQRPVVPLPERALLVAADASGRDRHGRRRRLAGTVTDTQRRRAAGRHRAGEPRRRARDGRGHRFVRPVSRHQRCRRARTTCRSVGGLPADVASRA